MAYRGSLNAPYGFGSNRIPELDALKRNVSQWRDYNQTWLDKNLSGEAADEYKRASTHWGFGGADNPAKELGYLREDVESEVSKLQSIYERLHMWPPAADLTSPLPSGPQPTPGAPIFIVHGSDTMRAEAIARTVERATGRDTIILREQPNLGQTLIEKFESNATQAPYAIIVLTPDDQGSRKGETDTRPRGRQNVIFEMGYFYGRIGRRNVAVLIDATVEKPSDTDGIAYIALDDNGAWKSELFRELHHANINVIP
jgi:predicted nucleotide-binding protein